MTFSIRSSIISVGRGSLSFSTLSNSLKYSLHLSLISLFVPDASHSSYIFAVPWPQLGYFVDQRFSFLCTKFLIECISSFISGFRYFFLSFLIGFFILLFLLNIACLLPLLICFFFSFYLLLAPPGSTTRFPFFLLFPVWSSPYLFCRLYYSFFKLIPMLIY